MFESVEIVSSSRASSGGALVLGVFQPTREGQRPALDKGTQRFDTDGSIADALARPESTGEVGRVVETFPTSGRKAGFDRVITVGLGKAESLTADTVRLAAAAVGRRLADSKTTSALIELGAALEESGSSLGEELAGRAFGESIGLLSFTFDGLKGTASKGAKRGKLSLRASSRKFSGGMETGLGLAKSANISRWLSATPPNIATPAWIAQQARAIGRSAGLTVTVLEGAALMREKMTGLINVGQASVNKPCLVRLEYKPKGGAKAKDQPVVLIGKTMTYDTGGLSLKINNGMRGMKGDKDGGCAVLGAMHAIATVIKPKRRVVALLAVAENSVSDNAYRPDDIITFRNGVSVEVTNTDAEGRLVLADALCWAKDKENPAAIIDIATLTGGVIVALGSTFAGMFCEDAALRARVEEAAGVTGERVWRLPMHQEYQDMMKSQVADIINSNPDRKAHPIQGAAFLAYFVDPKTPWCHLDIAGMHVDESGKGPFVKGLPSGFGVRLMAEVVASM